MALNKLSASEVEAHQIPRINSQSNYQFTDQNNNSTEQNNFFHEKVVPNLKKILFFAGSVAVSYLIKKCIDHKEKSDGDLHDSIETGGIMQKLSDIPAPEEREKVYLWGNCLFEQKEVALLVGPSGVGKTWITSALGRYPLEKGIHFIFLDDPDDDQLNVHKYANIHNRNSILKGSDFYKLERIVEELFEARATKRALKKTLFSNLMKLLPYGGNIYDSFERNLALAKREIGIKNKVRLTKMLCLAIYIDSLQGETDYIVIDGLYRLSESGNDYFSPKDFNVLISAVKRNNIGACLVHHSNKAGKYSGGSNLIRPLDACYTLSHRSDEENAVILELEVTKSRHKVFKNRKMLIKKEAVSKYEAKFTFLDDSVEIKSLLPNSQSIADIAKDILQSHPEDTISFKALQKAVINQKGASIEPESLRKKLSVMRHDGLIDKADGRTWMDIVILTGATERQNA